MYPARLHKTKIYEDKRMASQIPHHSMLSLVPDVLLIQILHPSPFTLHPSPFTLHLNELRSLTI